MPTYVADDGVELFYEESGDGRLLVTLSGGGGRHPSYLGNLAGLPGHLVIPHLRGVGKSPTRASYWDQARDVEALRRHLGLDQLNIVAHSAGTRLAMAYAAQYPDMVASMLLITPPSAHLTNTEPDADEITAHRRGEPAFEAALAAMSHPATTQAEFTEWLAVVAPAMYASWTPTAKAHAQVGATDFETVRAFLNVTLPPDFPERLGKTQAKVRVIAGAEDYTTGLAPVLAASRLFPNGEAVVIDDCGHFPWVEQPRAFRRAADPFVA